MTVRRGVLAYPFSLAAILIFTGLLVFALWRLWSTEAALRTQAGDNMLWAIAQAQVATQQLDITLAQERLEEADADALALRYDVLLSRLTLLEDGPQRRYLADLGHFETIHALAERVYARENAFLSAGVRAGDAGEPLHELLAELAREIGRAANRAMVAQWNETGAQLDKQHGAIMQVIATVIVILAIGAFISWRMLAAVHAEQRAQMSLLREQEIREAYRSFVALVSHQFRTPLSVIDASMQRILRAGDLMPRAEIRQRAGRVRETVKGLTDLMQATLDSMKLEAGRIEVKKTECDIAAELETARKRQLDASPGRTIHVDTGSEVPARITTDALLFQQIVGNLLANALIYSPQTEPVTVRVRADSSRIRIAVEDRGIGIPEEEKDRLFQPFFRASTAAKVNGVGMGLHLSRRLARMLGGDLTFESRQGFGSTFTLALSL
ncbi:HAMP domain-containing sensor histidine kinase [Chelativorans sp. M5D2P16]|uniref:sensor histidine kinase n=1 Tax=Chelativorans sp. M5D2P16 TaxID=3095678 RepID=UPI002ACABDF2|nr:HAMP domain-containing sensor histidine kinase [Chelativorans sp. M5D2P16]MDZ5697903.1 HAMP domain-containing sensor histidine kinase [Chelativorans sp. M5D2P16]